MTADEMADLASTLAAAGSRPGEGIACIVILADVRALSIVTVASVPSVEEFDRIMEGCRSAPQTREVYRGGGRPS
jgi:hypothetical protein